MSAIGGKPDIRGLVKSTGELANRRAASRVLLCSNAARGQGGIDGRFGGYLSRNRKEVFYRHPN